MLKPLHPLVPQTRVAPRPRRHPPVEALGGYPTRSQAEVALAEALARRSRGFALDPAKLTVNQYLDRWLAHIQTTVRARTVARYQTLLAHHVRPYIGAQLLKFLEPLQVQAIYDQLAVGGRRDGKPGGLAPQHILAVNRCLHRSLEQAVAWRLLPHNATKDATPPPRPHRKAVPLTTEQVAVLLDAADHSPSPWLGPWTVLAATTGARNGELCGLGWADLDLDAGTIRFRQALTVVDSAVLPHRREQLRLRLAVGQPATIGLRWVEPGQPPRPVELDLVFRTERGTPVNPNHASRAFAAWPPAPDWRRIPTCCATRWRRRWRPTRNRPASLPPSCAMPTVVHSPSACTSTSSLRLRHGWPD